MPNIAALAHAANFLFGDDGQSVGEIAYDRILFTHTPEVGASPAVCKLLAGEVGKKRGNFFFYSARLYMFGQTQARPISDDLGQRIKRPQRPLLSALVSLF
jgi:hypothetical protein